jgi:chromosome segregation ATPase
VEIEELKNEVESLAKGKSQAVSISKELEGKLIEMNGKVDDAIRQLSDANSTKARLTEENLTLTRRVEIVEFELTSIQSIHRRTQGDLEEARLHLESEMAVSEV